MNSRLIRWYNEERLHSALGFLRPADYYRGDPEQKYAERIVEILGHLPNDEVVHRDNLTLVR